MISQTSISAAKVKRATRRAKASNLRQGKMIKNHTEPASILADDHVDSAFAARTAPFVGGKIPPEISGWIEPQPRPGKEPNLGKE